MQRIVRFSVIALGLMISPAMAQTLPAIDADNIQIGVVRFQLIQHEKEVGQMYYAARIEDGLYIIDDTTTLLPDVRETGTFAADASTYEIRSLAVDADFSRRIVDADLALSSGRLVGEYGMRNPGDVRTRKVVVDEEIPSAVIPRGVIFGIIGGMPMEKGRVYEFKWFATFSGAVDDVKVTVGGKETVTVPAGTFEVFRVDIEAKPNNVAYITVAEPRKVVRIDVPGRDMRFERLPDEDGE